MPPSPFLNSATKLFLLLSLGLIGGSSIGIGGGLGIASAGPVILLRFFLELCGLAPRLGRFEELVTNGSLSLPVLSDDGAKDGRGIDGGFCDSGEGGGKSFVNVPSLLTELLRP
jgi:hypothetical protein